MHHRRTLYVLVTLVAMTGAARVALADDPRAEALYQEGRRAAQAKDWATACAKFRESHDREPAPGTLLNLADCEENRGKLLDAMARFEAAARLFKAGDDRATYARQRVVAIEKRLPKLVLRVQPTAPTGTTVERDGTPVDTALLGSAVPADPGEHTIVVHAPGRADARSTVRLAERESRDLELAPGPVTGTSATEAPRAVARAAAPQEPSALAGIPAPTAPPPRPEVKPPPKASPAWQRTAGYISLGVGGAGVAFGLVAGLLTANAKSTVDSNCFPPGCNQDGLDAQSRGRTWSAVSTASFIVGGIGLAAGAGLLLFTPSAPKRAATFRVGPVPGGAVLGVSGAL
jgi:hypothetical protein